MSGVRQGGVFLSLGGSPETLTRLVMKMQFLKNTAASFFVSLALVACGGSGSGGSQNLGSTAFPSTTVNGKVTFDMVPVAVSGAQPRLNYAATARQPARAIVVEAIDGNSQEVLATASTNAAGDYTLVAPNNRSVFIRAVAKMNSIGVNAAPFSVVDNTDRGAQWATEGAVFGSGTVSTLTQNLNAGSGWTGTAYDNTQRAAGPFAILDTVYQAAQKVIASDTAAAFPALEINWSPNNIAFVGDLALGQIGTSFFTVRTTTNGAQTRQIYVLGFANNDTDEYDRHVVAHEFGHYLQNAFSRDDSVGGLHGQSDRLDMRVAFSEGWGNAWSGIALANPVYSDTNGPGQIGGLSVNVSQGDSTNPGWFKEASVQKVFWDFSNSPAIGFTPMWNALKNGLTRSAALVGIHAYARALADANPAATAAISNILATQAIAMPTSPYFENETNFGSPALTNVNPIYLSYGALGSTLGDVCVGNAADPLRHGNKAGEFRYVRISLAQAGARTVSVTQTSGGASDPDFVLYNRTGGFLQAKSDVRNAETITASLPAGDYVLALTDYNLSASGSPVNATNCFSITVR